MRPEIGGGARRLLCCRAARGPQLRPIVVGVLPYLQEPPVFLACPLSIPLSRAGFGPMISCRPGMGVAAQHALVPRHGFVQPARPQVGVGRSSTPLDETSGSG